MNQLLEQHIVPAMSAMSMSALFTSSPSTTSLTDQLDFEEINREATHNKMVVTMKSISLKVAEAIADTVIHTAISRNYAPITVVVLDSWGHTVVSKRMDGCAPVGIPQFAHAKANTCIIMRTSSSTEFRDKYVVGNDQSKICQLNSMVDLAGNVGGMAPFPGGILLQKKIKHPITGKEENNILGAVGVSGAKGVEDELCALAGLHYFSTAPSSATELSE